MRCGTRCGNVGRVEQTEKKDAGHPQRTSPHARRRACSTAVVMRTAEAAAEKVFVLRRDQRAAHPRSTPSNVTGKREMDSGTFFSFLSLSLSHPPPSQLSPPPITCLRSFRADSERSIQARKKKERRGCKNTMGFAHLELRSAEQFEHQHAILNPLKNTEC